MDKYNRFFSKGVYRLVRLDWLVIMLGLGLALGDHWRSVNWARFWAYFWIIDIIGTAPGMYFHYRKRAGERHVPRWCFLAYNTCHSFVTHGFVIAGWYLVAGAEWAMLAMPLHIAADRGIFGNIYKSWGLAFEPEPDAGFAQFDAHFERETRRLELSDGALTVAHQRGE